MAPDASPPPGPPGVFASDADVPVTPAATFCAVLVEQWCRRGLRHAVVCPGSRSTPLALALAAEPRVTLSVCVDERSGGFLALGLARATRGPVPVVTTSGTATVNLHPAVVEAHHDLVPLIACTADRPPELHGVGAPQTIDQRNLYGVAVRHVETAGAPEHSEGARWGPLARRVWALAAGAGGSPPGPVQLNLAFREPLVGRPGPTPDDDGPDGAVVGPGGVRGPRGSVGGLGALAARCDGRRVLVVAGPPLADLSGLMALAQRWNWVVVRDPRVPVPSGVDPGIAHADSLLRDAAFASRVRPDVVLRLGSLPASKTLGLWLDGLEAHQVGIDAHGRRFDPGGSLDELRAGEPGVLVAHLDAVLGAPGPLEWVSAWSDADGAADRAIDTVLGASTRTGPGLAEPAVARLVTAAARTGDAALVVSSSLPIRDVEWFGVRGVSVTANRGANGIDGVVSTAAGVARGLARPTLALLGDLALLHDTNGLLALRDPEVRCLLVVVDNDGGGIFGQLPQARLLAPGTFEQLFGTPHGLDLVAVARAHGVTACRVRTVDELRGALGRMEGLEGSEVVVVDCDRAEGAALRAKVHTAVADAVAAPGGGGAGLR